MTTSNKKGIEQLINKNYFYHVDSNITTANFPVPEKIETEGWKLIKMDKPSTSQEVLDKIKAKGYRPANIYELATWFNSHKKDIKGKNKWYVALGQFWLDSDGSLRMPGVGVSSDGDFHWYLGDFGGVWGDSNAFLCFCDPALGNLETQNMTSLQQTISQSEREFDERFNYDVILYETQPNILSHRNVKSFLSQQQTIAWNGALEMVIDIIQSKRKGQYREDELGSHIDLENVDYNQAIDDILSSININQIKQ